MSKIDANSSLFALDDKVIVITGGTGVLGSAMAKYLAGEGARVVIIGRSEASAKALLDEISAAEGKTTFISADVTMESDLESATEALRAEFGKIDVLINAAGGNMPGAVVKPNESIMDSDTEAVRGVMELNYLGTYLPIKIFLPLFLDNGKGSIINVSSMSADRPLSRVMGYSSAKAAIDNLTKWLAVEFAAKYGESLRVNAIAPGFFLTHQNKELLTNQDGSLTSRGQQIVSSTPMKRFGDPQELLGAVHWLCSDASSFVTGTIVPVDGGFGAFSGV
ncbi:SDR family oxidoreductase [Poritiphilus flavus]|uniref:SDR family oxidoreductase n=1 Tax=Poritiphilus flavus TaxID=2697053 RepID=A0A6L9EGH3_9FLAO|nr:SDR family oxidoreductase [Poritiphilus flavus]NAS13825.1 SDR family oxidoreductase [Poritiphilus flavus]